LILALRGEIQALKLRLVSTTTVKVTDGETGAIVDGPKPIECRKYGLKNVLNGRAQLTMRECASNTRTWARFGLSALCVLSFDPQ
jgi:hypothetical protein